jgi:hypothetical protein
MPAASHAYFPTEDKIEPIAINTVSFTVQAGWPCFVTFSMASLAGCAAIP